MNFRIDKEFIDGIDDAQVLGAALLKLPEGWLIEHKMYSNWDLCQTNSDVDGELHWSLLLSGGLTKITWVDDRKNWYYEIECDCGTFTFSDRYASCCEECEEIQRQQFENYNTTHTKANL